jgi:hypothetical protein
MKIIISTVVILNKLLLILVLATGMGVARANAEKEEPPEPQEDVNYVDEKGVRGRGGYMYKHVAREDAGKPETKPKQPYKPPVKEEKKAEGEHGGEGGEGGEKKEEKKEEKKDEKKDKKEDKKDKKAEGEHGGGEHEGGGHGGHEEKKPPPLVPSTIYDPKIIKLTTLNHPFKPALRTTPTADYYQCKDLLSDKYRDIVFNELSTFSDQMGLPRPMPSPCMIKIAKPGTKFPDAVFVEFYEDDNASIKCQKYGHCGSNRLMMMYIDEKDKDTKGFKPIYRTYVLTDEKQYKRGSFCVAPDGHLLGERNCYVILHPDWLFN